MITFTSSVQVSGVRFQQPISYRCVGVADVMDFFSPVLAFSCNQINVQDSEFGIYWHLKPDTWNHEQTWSMAEPIISNLAHMTRIPILNEIPYSEDKNPVGLYRPLQSRA